MWVEERNGKYRYYERYKDPLTGKTYKVSCLMQKNTKQAQNRANEKLQAMIREKLSRETPESLDLTVHEIVEAYQRYKLQMCGLGAMKEATYDKSLYMYKYLDEVLGASTKVSMLNARLITSALLKSDEDVHTLNERLTRLKALLRWAYSQDLIKDISYLDKLKPFPETVTARERIREKYMESSELAAVLEAMKEERWKLLTKFLCLSGLRIGEAIALNNSDIEDGYILVSKTYSLPLKKVTAPKTDDSNRKVFIQPELSECIREIKREMRKQALLFGYRTEIFFPDYDGGYLHYDNFRIYFERRTNNTIGRKLTPHACRHTMVSLFAESGVSLDAISRRLGHSDSKITKDVYFHVTKKLIERDNMEFANVRFLG